MKNFVQPGGTLTLTAPYAVNSGDGALVGTIFGVACIALANGVDGEFQTEGVFDLAALATDTPAQGAAAYWDNVNKRLTTTAAGNTKIGVFVLAKANGVAVGRVRLNAAF